MRFLRYVLFVLLLINIANPASAQHKPFFIQQWKEAGVLSLYENTTACLRRPTIVSDFEGGMSLGILGLLSSVDGEIIDNSMQLLAGLGASAAFGANGVHKKTWIPFPAFLLSIAQDGLFFKYQKMIWVGILIFVLVILLLSFYVLYLKTRLNQMELEAEEEHERRKHSDNILMLQKNEIVEKNKEIEARNDELQAQNKEFVRVMEKLSENHDRLSTALEHVRHSEMRYKEFVEFLPEVVFELDKSGYCRYMNSKGLLAFSLEQADLENGWSLFKAMMPRDHQRFRRMLEDLSEHEASSSHGDEFQFMLGGELREFFVIVMVSTENGKFEGFKGIAIDVGGRKKIERQVQVFSDVIQRMQMGLYVYEYREDARGANLFLAHYNTYSRTYIPAEIDNPLGKSINDIFPALDSAGVKAEFVNIAIEGGTYHRRDFEFMVSDGNSLFFDFKAFSLEERVVGVLFEDVTKRKIQEQEQHLTQYGITHAADPIFRILQSGRIVYVNPAATKLLGFKESDFFEMHVWDLDPRITQAQWNEWIEVLRKKDSVVMESYYRHQNGIMISVETLLNRVKYKDSEFYFAFVRDVTDRKKSEELERKIVVTQQAAAVKQQFLANMSHEIRTPMTGIMGMTSLLLRTDLDESQKEYVKNIKVSSEALLGIINDVLDLSKIEAGRMELRPEPVRFVDFCFEIRDVFSVLAVQKEVGFVFEVAPEVPSVLKIDTLRLRQVIANLLSNAFKFTEEGRIEVKFDLQKQEKNRVLLVGKVKDTGIGIKEEDVGRLFSKFTQLDTSLTRKFEGTGLGLAICRELVALMGGEINVYSELGKGSVFVFSFYADYENESALPEKTDGYESGKALGLKILLVEDKYINRKVVGLMLDNFGCEVEMANDGRQALDVFEKGAFDVILMDIQMPVMDGISSMKELRKRHGKIPPVIGLSANAMEGDAEKYLQEGMDDYVSKPFKPEVLYDKLKKWGNADGGKV